MILNIIKSTPTLAYASTLAFLFTFFLNVSHAQEPSVATNGHLNQSLYMLSDIPDKEPTFRSLAELSNEKPILLEFWSTECNFCKKAHPALYEIYKKYHASVSFIGINTDGLQYTHDIEKYKVTDNYVLPIAIDLGGILQNYFGVPGTPTFILLNSRGELIFKTHSISKKLVAKIEDLRNL